MKETHIGDSFYYFISSYSIRAFRYEDSLLFSEANFIIKNSDRTPRTSFPNKHGWLPRGITVMKS